ncbi:MAG: glycosyltransferase family 2 protein [Cellvibrionaceae bacterium]|nr:glycosyltransferase family 2 protein [Cellvibrionaceae bacterium]
MSTAPVSIGMPIYNGERYLENTLDSVLAQTFSDFTFYISDNASTDKTQEICERYAAKDSRIIYIRNAKNVGAAKNYDCCFTPATSEYFRWQNADDPIEPTLIEDCYNLLSANPDYVLTYAKSRIIDEHGALLRDYEDNLCLQQDSASERFIRCINDMRLQNLMYGLIRREPLKRTALLKAYTSSDLNLIAELSMYGKFGEVPKRLFSRRVHPTASSYDMKDKEKLKDFWDPSKRQLIMQAWRSVYEYFKATARAPISVREKREICTYLLRHTYWRKDVLATEISDLIKGTLKRAS